MFSDIVYSDLIRFIRYGLVILLLCFIPLFSIEVHHLTQGKPEEEKGIDQSLYKICLSHSHRVVYFRNQKCGNKTICSLLENYAEGTSFDKFAPFYPEDYEEYLKFSFVRNPWDRVVSCYIHKVKDKKVKEKFYKECEGHDFEFFVRFIEKHDLTVADRHIRLQSKVIPVDQLDYIGRYEDFEEELRSLLGILGVEVHEIPHKHNCPREYEHYSQYYSDEMRDIISRKYKQDIDIFGYEFQDLR